LVRTSRRTSFPSGGWTPRPSATSAIDVNLPLTLSLLVDTSSASARSSIGRTASTAFLDQMLNAAKGQAFVVQFCPPDGASPGPDQFEGQAPRPLSSRSTLPESQRPSAGQLRRSRLAAGAEAVVDAWAPAQPSMTPPSLPPMS
jgi:hypothetical protein